MQLYFIDSYPRVGFKQVHTSGKDLTKLHINRYISRMCTSQIDSHFKQKYSNETHRVYRVCILSHWSMHCWDNWLRTHNMGMLCDSYAKLYVHVQYVTL